MLCRKSVFRLAEWHDLICREEFFLFRHVPNNRVYFRRPTPANPVSIAACR